MIGKANSSDYSFGMIQFIILIVVLKESQKAQLLLFLNLYKVVLILTPH